MRKLQQLMETNCGSTSIVDSKLYSHILSVVKTMEVLKYVQKYDDTEQMNEDKKLSGKKSVEEMHHDKKPLFLLRKCKKILVWKFLYN